MRKIVSHGGFCYNKSNIDYARIIYIIIKNKSTARCFSWAVDKKYEETNHKIYNFDVYFGSNSD